MRYFSFLVFCLCGLKLALAQLVVTPATLDFGVVKENEIDSIKVTLKNPYSYDIQVSDIQTIDDNYGNSPFSVSQNTFTILAGDSASFWVKFTPIHNLFHESELVVVNDCPLGMTRIDMKAQGRYSNTYYTTTENLADEALKTALKTRIGQNYTSLGYTPARDQMYMQIDNQKVNGQGAAVNTIESVYTGQQVTNYASRVEAQNQGFNTEHTFPQAFFSSNEPMVSDLFHIFPTDDGSNSERGNKPFAMVPSPSWSVGGSKSSNTYFEPRDVQKGATARAMLYFVLRYQDYSCFEKNQETVLKQWHSQYLPTQVEKNRNNAIYSLQGNRNPFIDYPQFVQRLNYVTSCSTATGTSISSILIPKSSIDYGDVSINNPHIYDFLIVNDGNQALTISNISSPSQSISFSSNQDSTIEAGEAMILQVELYLNVLGAFASTVEFSTNISTQPNIFIPVTANAINTIAIEDNIINRISIAPNPAQDRLNIYNNNKPTFITIVDIFGKKLIEKPIYEALEIDISAYPKGMYILYNSEGESVKFIKE